MRRQRARRLLRVLRTRETPLSIRRFSAGLALLRAVARMGQRVGGVRRRGQRWRDARSKRTGQDCSDRNRSPAKCRGSAPGAPRGRGLKGGDGGGSLTRLRHREVPALVLRLCRGVRSVSASRFFSLFISRRFVTAMHYARTGQQGDRGKGRVAPGGHRLRPEQPALAREEARAPVGCLLNKVARLRRRSVVGRQVPQAHHHPQRPFFFCPG